MSHHDERVDDTLYSQGWRCISTQFQCKKRRCRCHVTGDCILGVFNHYMMREDTLEEEKEPSAFTFPITIRASDGYEMSIEEVRCRRHVLDIAYRYYNNIVLGSNSPSTFVSVVGDGCKSICFNIDCYMLDMEEEASPAGSLSITSGDPEETWVISRDISTTRAICDSLCNIGVDPVVCAEGSVALRGLRTVVDTSGFTCAGAGPNVLQNDSLVSNLVLMDPVASAGVRAVKTALVTVSILLTPKSMYGGKNPTTKTITYFIHNICYGRTLQRVLPAVHGSDPEGRPGVRV